jgi:hypothetical protein
MTNIPKELEEGIYIERIELNYCEREDDGSSSFNVIVTDDDVSLGKITLVYEGRNDEEYVLSEDDVSASSNKSHLKPLISDDEIEQDLEKLIDISQYIIDKYEFTISEFLKQFYQDLKTTDLLKTFVFTESDDSKEYPIQYSIKYLFNIHIYEFPEDKDRVYTVDVIALTKSEALTIYNDLAENQDCIRTVGRYFPKFKPLTDKIEKSHEVFVCMNSDETPIKHSLNEIH